MKKWFVSLIKTVFSIGKESVPAILNYVLPGIGPLVNTVVSAILTAEGKFGSGTGDQKFEYVQEAVTVASPAIIQALETGLNRELADENLFAAGLNKTIQGLVDVLNAFRILPKKA